jgi:hypothetical protein
MRCDIAVAKLAALGAGDYADPIRVIARLDRGQAGR